MYRRKIETILQNWKDQAKRKPVMQNQPVPFSNIPRSIMSSMRLSAVYNIGREGALLTIPFYMAFLLKES